MNNALFHDEYLPISDVPALLPGRPHIATVWRWTRRGVRGHVLPVLRVGGRAHIGLGALREFLAKLHAPAVDAPRATSGDAQSRRAAAILDRAGIK